MFVTSWHLIDEFPITQLNRCWVKKCQKNLQLNNTQKARGPILQKYKVVVL